MADFRRWFTVLAMIALFTGIAAAQAQITPFQCSAVAQVTPTLRSEGLTELTGDIVLTCTGGNPIPANTVIPQANIIVSVTAPVTSRVVSGTTGASEALLLIDEPTAPITAPVTGFGPQAPLKVCTSTSGGCVEYATQTTGTVNGVPGTPVVVATNTAGDTVPGFNVFQGVINGTNQVWFNGVPILPPATTGLSRVYRITNIRVNANGAGSSLISGIQPVYAYLSTGGGSTALPVSNQALTVGFVQTSLTVKATPVTAPFTQCNTTTLGNVGLLSYTENFPSAFKTRVTNLISTAGGTYLATNAGSAPGTGQNVPGQLYNTESGFILPLSGTFTAGLADYGTRFKAVFNNLPNGITLWVTTTNVNSNGTAATIPTGGAGGTGTGTLALLTSGTEGAGYATWSTSAGNTATVGTNTVVPIGSTSSTTSSLTAVWEVVNAQLAATETFNFGVYISYAPAGTSPNNTPTLTPATGGPSVTQSYAPISAVTTPSTTQYPRFVLGANPTTQPILSIVPCSTVLLFPYVTTMSGLDTGIAISNTALDPLGTSTASTTLSSQGSCRLYFYGSNLSSTAITPGTTPPSIGPIAPGNPDYTKAAFLARDMFGINVTGYMFAVCDFQYAHGFAFISDVGVRNVAMGYLALVVNNGTNLTRPGLAQVGESLNN